MYNENCLVDVLKIDADIKWIKFGAFGREEAALIIGTKCKHFSSDKGSTKFNPVLCKFCCRSWKE